MSTIQKIKGTRDFFDLDAEKFRYIEQVCSNEIKKFGFKEMITPIFENTAVFNRLGEQSDIVTKEMYTFFDRSNRSITLRPEGTAPVVRAFIENKIYANSIDVNKYFYFGPIFRYERPQAGRYRQFHQFGVEAFGNSTAILDVDIILSAWTIIEKLNLQNIVLKINTIGDLLSRDKYQKALVEYFNKYTDKLCNDCKVRLEKNPMRILDCKVDVNQDFMKNAPKIKDYLSQESIDYFNEVLRGLDTFGIKYEIDENLVRGLDYYTDTVFEFIIKSDDELNNLAICAGGKYGNLVKDLNGPDIPGVGYAFGVERLIELMDRQNVWPSLKINPEIFIMALDEQSKIEAQRLALYLRKLGLKVEFDYKNISMKPQFRLSEKLNVEYILIIGENERKENLITVKDVANKTQVTIPISDLLNYLPYELINAKEGFCYDENAQ
ncbi:MAG TPA: histidine--tRNA ligase [Bacilli bacterium]|nr:histidine--tRNA ligase [Bacilli bacterium]